MNLERVRDAQVKIVGETDWHDDLRRWAARIIVFTAFAIVAFLGVWFIVHVETPALYQMMGHTS